uniref:Uncharacterized protein n=1 Tax=Glossina palpalis gambiensis TaxID=67801 RepID=A0A1B0B6Y9_9MUSC
MRAESARLRGVPNDGIGGGSIKEKEKKQATVFLLQWLVDVVDTELQSSVNCCYSPDIRELSGCFPTLAVVLLFLSFGCTTLVCLPKKILLLLLLLVDGLAYIAFGCLIGWLGGATWKKQFLYSLDFDIHR